MRLYEFWFTITNGHIAFLMVIMPTNFPYLQEHNPSQRSLAVGGSHQRHSLHLINIDAWNWLKTKNSLKNVSSAIGFLRMRIEQATGA
jgi:hypothetical protein